MRLAIRKIGLMGGLCLGLSLGHYLGLGLGVGLILGLCLSLGLDLLGLGLFHPFVAKLTNILAGDVIMKTEYIGRRVRLLSPMVNIGSEWKPVEDLPVGLEGVVVWAQDEGETMGIDWDNGSKLNLFMNEDKWEFCDG